MDPFLPPFFFFFWAEKVEDSPKKRASVSHCICVCVKKTRRGVCKEAKSIASLGVC